MEGDGFTTTAQKGGGKKKEFITPLPSVLDQQKKKKKGAGLMTYGGAAAAATEDGEEETAQPQVSAASKMMAAFAAAGGDSDEDKGGKKGKKNQRDKKERQGKKGKGKKAAADSDNESAGGEEKPEESTAGATAAATEEEEEEEVKVAAAPVIVKKGGMPVDVVYCRVCGVPPEYCMFDKKDSSECKAWVLKEHPELHNQIYGAPVEGAEEKKDDLPVQQVKKKKKVSMAPSGDADVKVYKAKRGGKKVISTVVGLHHYGIPMKDITKVMGKKFACGAAYVLDDEKYGECIQVQGDISERFLDFVEGELAKYKVPAERVKFEEVKKKKKAAEEAGGADDDDE